MSDRVPLSITNLPELHEKLVASGRLYESQNLDDQREAVVDALLAVLEYLSGQGFDISSLGPLARPAQALEALEHNKLDLLFAERRGAGRPSNVLTDHERTGILAALADVWLRSHTSDPRTMPEKLREAARQMKGRWFGTITVAQLKSARALVGQEQKGHPAVRWADFASEWIDSTFAPNRAFDDAIAFLNEHRLPFGLGEGGISKTPHVSPYEKG